MTENVKAVLSAVDKNFVSTFQKASQASESLGARLKRGLGFGMTMAAGQKAFNMLTSGFTALSSHTDAAISRLDTLNNYPNVMKSLGFSKKQAADAMKTLDKGINDLPTTMDEIVKSSNMLTASLNDIDKGSKSAVALNDMFLAGGQGAEAASRALTQYNQILAKGKVDQQSWNTLVEVAPAQLNQVAKELMGAGKGQKQLYEALQSGTVSIDDFNSKIIELDKKGGKGFDSFADQARAATQGIGTSMKNVGTAVTKNLANIIGGIDGKMKELNKDAGIAALFNTLKDGINKVGKDFTKSKAFDAIAGKAVKFSNILTKNVPKAFNAVTSYFKKFAPVVGQFGSAMGKLFSNIGKSGALQTIAKVAGTIAFGLAKAAAAVAEFISKIPPSALKAIILGFVGIKAGLGGVRSVMSIFGKTAGSTMAGVGKGIGSAMAGIGRGLALINPITILAIGGAILMLCGGLTLLATQGSGLATIIQGIGTAVGTVAQAIMTGIAQAIAIVAPALPSVCAALSLLAPLVVSIGEAVAAASPAIEALGSAISMIIESIGTAVATILPPVFDAFTNLAQIVTSAITNIVAALAPFIPNIQAMVEAVAPVLNNMITAFTTLVEQIKPILDSLSNLVSTCLTGISDTVTSIGDLITNVVTAIGDSISSVLDSVAGIFDSIGNAALNAGTGFDLLAGGISTLVALPLKDMVATLAGTAKGISKIGKESSGISAIGNSFKSIGSGIMSTAKYASVAASKIVLIVSTSTKVQASLKTIGSVGSSAMTQLASALSKGASIGTSAMAKFASGIKSGASAASAAAKAAAMNVTTGMRSGYGGAYSAGAYVGLGFANGIKSMYSRVSEAAAGLADQANKTIVVTARIGSPSKLTRQYGEWYGEGFELGILDMARSVRRASEALVSIPSVSASDVRTSGAMTASIATPDGGTTSLAGEITDAINNRPLKVDTTIEVDGKQFARSTATYNKEEISKLESRDSRRKGIK